MSRKNQKSWLLARIALLFLLVVLLPNSLPNRDLVKPAAATPLVTLGIWNSTYASRSVLDPTLTLNSPLVLKINVTGIVPRTGQPPQLSGFGVIIRWDSTVLNGVSATEKGGIFDCAPTCGAFSQLVKTVATDHIEFDATLLGAPTIGNGTIFTFTLKVVGTTASTVIHIDASSQLTQPAAVPYVPLDGFFSNSPSDDDILLTSLNANPERVTRGDTVTISVGLRNVGTTPMLNVRISVVANQTIAINSTLVGPVVPNSAQTVQLLWNTTSYNLGAYDLNATLTTSSTDTFPGDNSLPVDEVIVEIHDLAVTTLSGPSSAPVNSTVQLNLSVKNLGSVEEKNVNVTIIANSRSAVNLTLDLLPGDTEPTYPVSWNTHGFAAGTYLLTAFVQPVPGEKNVTNNSFTDGQIRLISIQHDLGITGILPQSAIVDQNITLIFSVTNNGLSTENYTVKYFLGPQQVLTRNGGPISVASTQTVQMTWNTRSFSAGTYTTKANVTILPTTVQDDDATNNQIVLSSFNLRAHQPPIPRFTVNPAVAEPQTSTTFNASQSSSPQSLVPLTFTWDFGDGTSGRGQVVGHSYSNSGTVSVALTITDSLGGSATRTQSVRVNSPPTAKASANPTQASAGSSVTFDATSSTDSDGTIAAYQWDFGDGSTGSGQTTTHTYNAAGDYTVKLTVTDNDTATNITTFTLTINPAPFPLVYVLSGVGAAVVAGGGFVLWARRRKPKTPPTTKGSR